MTRPSGPVRARGPATLILSISAAGLLASAGLALPPGEAEEGDALRKPLVGSLFASICVLGMIAVLRPGPCSTALGFRPRGSGLSQGMGGRNASRRRMVGHHPDCESFSFHVLRIWGREMCAGCTGLLIGGLLALLLATSHFLGGMPSLGSRTALIAGLVCVSFALLVLALDSAHPWVRLLGNALLAVGSFLVLAAVDTARKNLYVDLLVLCIVIYWIMGRIMLSRLNHRLICSRCSDPLCPLGARSLPA